MTEEELIAGARRELLHNIAVTPIVLLVRVPLGLIYASLDAITEALEWANEWLPAWKRDYAQALRRHRHRQRDTRKAELLPERTGK